jgi:DNA-binding NarL/FixJ family response regulator
VDAVMIAGTIMIRALVAATYPIARAGLTTLIRSDPEIEIAGAANDTDELITLVESLAPDIILLDPGDDPESWLESLSSVEAFPPVLLLAGSPEFAAEAVRVGVRGLLLRDATSEEIAEAIRAAARGLVVLDQRVAAVFTEEIFHPAQARPEPSMLEPLTDREREILQFIARGLPNKAIAAELRISEHTVKFHVGSIFDKLGVSSRAEAVAQAGRAGLIVF